MISLKRGFGILLILIIMVNYIEALSLGELQYSPQIIHPGEDVDLWIKVTNDEDKDLKNIEVSVKPHYPFELKQVNPKKGIAVIPHLNPGESDIVYFKLHIDDDAVAGEYRLDVTVSYDIVEEEGEEVVTSYTWTKVYYLPVHGTPNFEIEVSNTSLLLTPGRTETIPVSIYNRGTGKAKECTLSVGGNNYISAVGSTKFYIGTIRPQEGKVVNIRLHTNGDTPEGTYLLPVTLSWIDEEGREKRENIDIGFTVQGDILLSVSNVITTPREIKPGDSYVRLDVTVTNNGHGEAKDVKLHLKTSYPFRDSWSNANFKGIGTLKGGESKTVSFYIDVDKYAPPKHYRIPLYMEYLDKFNRRHNTTERIDVYVKSKPVLEIISKEYTVKAGEENLLLITVKNVGNEKAEGVRVSAIRNSAQPFDYPRKSDSIGTLNPGENGTGAIVVSVDKDAVPKEYLITLEIRAVGDRDRGDHNVYITQESIRVKVEREGDGMSLLLYGIIGILIIIGIIYLRKKL